MIKDLKDIFQRMIFCEEKKTRKHIKRFEIQC